MKTRTKATIVAAALTVTALAGGTLAIWADSATPDAVDVSTGLLNLNTADTRAYDVSTLQRPSVAGDGQSATWAVTDGTQSAIDLADFLFVPQDVVRVVVPIEVELAGDNLLARLDVAIDSPTVADRGFTVTNLGIVSAAEFDPDTTPVITGSITSATSRLFTQDDDGEAFFAVYQIAFDAATTTGMSDPNDGHMDISITDILDSVQVSLTQVRANPAVAGPGA